MLRGGGMITERLPDLGGDREGCQGLCPCVGLLQEAFPGQVLHLYGPEAASSLPDNHTGVSPHRSHGKGCLGDGADFRCSL